MHVRSIHHRVRSFWARSRNIENPFQENEGKKAGEK